MDHRNLLFMNNHCSHKVLQWKLDIQHYDDTIDHVPCKLDVFSRLVVRPQPVSLHHVLLLQCSPTRRKLIERLHANLYAHWGGTNNCTRGATHIARNEWHELAALAACRQIVRTELFTCQKIDARHKTISFTVYTFYAQIERISIDTIGFLPRIWD